MQKRRIIAAGILASVMAAGFGSRQIPVKAVFNENSAVHVDAEEIEDKTLALGTYLIQLDVMNDFLYELALESAGESGQQEIYYKSELGDGAWYKTGGAASLDAILPEGNRVENEVIEELFFTYQTKADGITYDLRTGQAVCIFDIMSPYDLNEIPELEMLRNQYQVMKNSGADTGFMDTFWGKEKGETSEEERMEECDEQLIRLQTSYLSLAAAGYPQTKLEIVLQIMGKIDSFRRYLSYTEIKSGLNSLIVQISSSSELSGNSDLLTALGTCLQEVQGRLDELEGEQLKEGKNAFSQVEYALMQEFAAAAGAGKIPGAEGTVPDTEKDVGQILDELSILYNIQDGIHTDIEKEKTFLDERLLPKAKELYESSGDKVAENEWKYYKTLRMRLDGEVQENQEVQDLKTELKELQLQKMQALDQEELDEARQLDIQFTDTMARLRKLEQEGVYGEESIPAKIQEQKEAAIKLMEEPDNGVDELQMYVEGIGALCGIYPQTACEALEEICARMQEVKNLENTSEYDELIQKADAILEESAEKEPDQAAYETILEILAQESGCTVIDGTYIQGTVQEQSTALCALAAYCRQMAEEREDYTYYPLLNSCAEALAKQDDSAVFEVLVLDEANLMDSEEESVYIPIDKIAMWCSYRYVWDKEYRKAILARRSSYYEFTAFDGCVGREKEKRDAMQCPALLRSVVCIPEDYVKQEFECSATCLAETGYAVLTDEEVEEKAEEISQLLSSR